MRDRIKLGVWFSVLLIIPLSFASCSEKPENTSLRQPAIPLEYIDRYLPASTVQPEFEMATPLPDFPDKVTVYRIEYPEVTAEYAREQAAKFNVSGEIREGDDAFYVTDDLTGDDVEVFKTGAIRYFVQSESFMEMLVNEEAELPSEDEAKRAAIDYLEERDLLPLEVKEYIRVGVGATGNKPLHFLVSFRYKIGDFQVEGPGYRYNVRIGDGGKAGGVFIFYPEVEPYAEVTLKTPHQALDDLAAGINSYWMDCRGDRAILDQVSLRYYLLPVIEKQEYVLPVYVFEGTAISKEGKEGSAAAAVMAVRVSDEELSVSKRNDFNFIFRYGVGAKNELNTFQGTYTKDMILAAPVTTNLSLTPDEMDIISNKMIEIDFFSYPKDFKIVVPEGESYGIVHPSSSYYFRVKYKSEVKELTWDNKDFFIFYKDEKADRLVELIKLIINIIETREEYQKLPPPAGRYM
jgi:hypothetical protein